MQNIVEFIKQEMSARGMTYDLLATYTGTTRQNIWIKLNKVYCPNFETIKKMLEVLGYKITIKGKDGKECKNLDTTALFECLEEEQVNYGVFERMLDALGFEVELEEEKLNKMS